MPVAAPARTVEDLKTLCREIRRDIIRMICAAGSGHPGGSLSEVETLVALYFRAMRHRPSEPAWPDRDRFILSKGHGCPALYAVLAHAGYLDRASLPTLRKLGSPLQGHPDRRVLPILEASTGSLGQGLSIGVGAALAFRLDRRPSRVWVLTGDGELEEGQIWEAAISAAHHKLDNLTLVVDANRFQLDDSTEKVLRIEPIVEKWRACGWEVLDVDGHDVAAMVEALEASRRVHGRPTAIVARTVKGKGVSFMENNNKWHGVAPTKDEAEKALAELEGPP